MDNERESVVDLAQLRALALEVQTWAPNASTMYYERIDAVCTGALAMADEIETLQAAIATSLSRSGCNLSEAAVALCVEQNEHCSCAPLIALASRPEASS